MIKINSENILKKLTYIKLRIPRPEYAIYNTLQGQDTNNKNN